MPFPGPILKGLARPLAWISQFAVPHLCLNCGAPALPEENPALCGVCRKTGWDHCRCPRCGRGCHEIDLAGPRCGHCRQIRQDHESVQALGPYQNWLRKAILRYKFHHCPLAKRYLERRAREFTIGAGVISYVASHPDRVRARGAKGQHLPPLLAGVARESGCPVVSLLHKLPGGKPQVELSGRERRQAVVGTIVFQEGQEVPPVVHLIDDVWTTGSTLHEAARVLSQAGTRSIHLHVFAMIHGPHGQPEK